MQAVDVEEIDRTVRQVGQRLVEGTAQKSGEGAVTSIVELSQIRIHLFAIKPGLLVSLPRVDGEAAGIELIANYGLAEGRIGHAAVRTELDEHTRGGCTNDPVGEWDMTTPGADDASPGQAPEQRIKFRRPEIAEQRIRIVIFATGRSGLVKIDIQMSSHLSRSRHALREAPPGFD